jgi:hypothetical protein
MATFTARQMVGSPDIVLSLAMFGRRRELPVSPEQQEWIEKSFRLLTHLFGDEWLFNAPVVLPNEEFFPRKWEETEDWARYAFDRVCVLMHVQPERVDLVLVNDVWAELRRTGVPIERPRDVAGTYQEIKVEDGPSRAQICVKDSLIHEPEQMVATMAHELAHVLLLGDNKVSRDVERMEPLTDLMTVFCGFGVLTANAAHVHRSGHRGWQVSNLGYLSQGDFGYALAVFAWARGESNPSWAIELTTNVRAFLRATLSCFKASKKPIRNSS